VCPGVSQRDRRYRAVMFTRCCRSNGTLEVRSRNGGALPTRPMNDVAPSLRSFLTVLLVAAFGLNWVWEMVQGPAYAELARLPWQERLLICTVAAVGDGVITLGIYAVGALAAGRMQWGMEGGRNVYVAVALLGAACAVAIEWRARAFGLWSYTEWMPVVPVLEIGLWPFLQLMLLMPASLWIAVRWTLRPDRQSGSVPGR